jgi:hypothetical protein
MGEMKKQVIEVISTGAIDRTFTLPIPAMAICLLGFTTKFVGDETCNRPAQAIRGTVDADDFGRFVCGLAQESELPRPSATVDFSFPHQP